jgi:4-carboxymuconolactone decarboxylase
MARLPAAATDDEVTARIRARRGGKLMLLDEMLLHSPPVADGWNSLLGAVRGEMTLPANVRELVVLRVAVLNRADYEWQAHEPPAREAGVTDAELAEIRQERPVNLSPEVLAAVAYADAMTRDITVPDALYDALGAFFDDRQIVELTATAAVYNMVSRFLVALEVGQDRASAVVDSAGVM